MTFTVEVCETRRFLLEVSGVESRREARDAAAYPALALRRGIVLSDQSDATVLRRTTKIIDP